MDRRTVRDLRPEEVRGRRVLVRVDFNVPLDEARRVTDDTRIRAAIPTLELLLEHGAAVILLSHLGRPKGAADPKYSLRPVAVRLAELLPARSVTFHASTDDDAAITASRQLKSGAVLLLENTRFLAGEERNEPELSRRLAQLGDLYVNDAFGAAHRAHASTAGVAEHLRPAVAGLLMERELQFLSGALERPERPFVAVLGGAKISGKIDVIEALLPKVDRMLIGGAMASTFFKAMGTEVGRSLVELDRVQLAARLLGEAGDKLLLPADAVVAPSLEVGEVEQHHVVSRDAIPTSEAMFDIGPTTADEFARVITTAKTVLWNGPMGVFEKPPFDQGTVLVAHALARATEAGATTIVGGGDSAAAIGQAGLDERVSHVSTGGGASLEFLEGKLLPGVEVLDRKRRP